MYTLRPYLGTVLIWFYLGTVSSSLSVSSVENETFPPSMILSVIKYAFGPNYDCIRAISIGNLAEDYVLSILHKNTVHTIEISRVQLKFEKKLSSSCKNDIIICEDPTEVSILLQQMHNTNVPVDYSNNLIVLNSGDKIILPEFALHQSIMATTHIGKKVYQITNILSGNLLGEWSLINGLQTKVPGPPAKEMSKDVEVRVAFFECPPFVIYTRPKENNVVVQYDGIEMRIIQTIFKGWKMRWLPLEPEINASTNSSRWTQVKDQVLRGEADVAMCSFWLTLALSKQIDTTVPWESLLVKFLVPSPRKVSQESLLYLGFDTRVWSLFIAVIVLFTLVFGCVASYTPEYNRYRDFLLVALDSVRIIVMNGISLSSLPKSVYVLITSWSFFSLLISTFYLTRYTYLLSFPPYTRNIDTFHDLVNSDLHWGSESDEFSTLLRNTDDKDLVQFADKFVLQRSANEREGYISPGKSAIVSKVLNKIVICDRYLPEERRNHLRLIEATIFSYPIAFLVQKNSLFKNFMSKFIYRITEFGLIEYWKKDVISNFGTYYVDSFFSANRPSDDWEPLAFMAFEGAFVLLGVGLLLSAIVFVLECLACI